MGWLFSYSGNKADLLAELRSPRRFVRTKLLMTRVVGNHHWYLVETPDGRKIVGLDLMESGGPSSGWGYKDMDETVGPYYYDCPLCIIDNATAPENQYAYDWRMKVRGYHGVRTEHKAKLQPGTVVRYGGNEYRLEESLGRRGWNVVNQNDYPMRLKVHQAAKAEIVSTVAA